MNLIYTLGVRNMSLIPIGKIKANLGIEPNGKVQKFFTNTCVRHMDKYIPKDTGMLRTNVDIQSDSITYQSPYAHYQYKGEREDGSRKVKNYTTPRHRQLLG